LLKRIRRHLLLVGQNELHFAGYSLRLYGRAITT
jgi:hypothetical protein